MIRFLNFFAFLAIILIALVRCGYNGSVSIDTKDPEETKNEVEAVEITPNDFLSDVKYKQLVVEAVYIEGYQPDSLSIYKIISFLDERIYKPKGLQLYARPIPATSKTFYSINDLAEIETSYRSKWTNDTILTAFIFIADGDYANNTTDSTQLGIAYGSSSIALFGKTIREYSGGENQPSTHTLETTVLKHEFGHLFGLVNNGTPMINNHLDSLHNNHCANPKCLMYYTAETNDFSTIFTLYSSPSLKSNCLEDLQNNGGK